MNHWHTATPLIASVLTHCWRILLPGVDILSFIMKVNTPGSQKHLAARISN